MLKNTFRRYLSNLKYIRIPFLTFFSFLAIALLVLYLTSKDTLKTFIENADSLSSGSLSYADYFNNLFSKLDFRNQFFSSLKTLFSIEFFQEMFLGINSMIEMESSSDKALLQIYEGTMQRDLQRNLIICYVILFLGLYLSNFLTHYILYKKNIQKKLTQSILSLLLDSLVISSILSLATYLSEKYIIAPILSYLVMILLQFFLSLLKSWIIFSKGKVKFRKAISMKSLSASILSHLLIHLLSYLIFLVLYFLLGPLLSFLCFVPLYCYSKNILSLSLDTYIDELRHEKKNVSLH